ncbi:subfamily B ATP-binding cassette protein HlyB/CyaB [Thiogranum longum]|uniref:Subfamily B ATP-binding cassette protein HlyB/CyaB n=1 Tax=Thiogranum longum TaxID=1537524 RepID=A0A4R1HCQ0_9GAMM|nr:type I secretion system permease/ATPase [Thiogranum longum]TCK19228.1 subfamily B ATP-binding cassette protein HlyB/CyaB [Thiogranum longum]
MPHTISSEASPDTGLSCLVLIARFLGVAAEAGQLRHRFARADAQLSSDDIVRASRHLGLKARQVSSRWEKLEKTPLPALAQKDDGQWVVLAKVDAERVLVQDPLEKRPLTLPRALFESAWNGSLILVTRRALLSDEKTLFGFRWFIPAILKYRKLFSEVLIASFFLQLFALITPLFFQVVIDKVLVHKGLTTLDVLAFGLIVVSIFEVVLGGLRTYVFSHTANRVDVELGARLYRHLISLPMSYFGARRVGDSVARVRELENVRNFITGSALTLVIDLFFTFVFLAVMYYYSPTLTWVVLASIPAYVLLSIFVTPILRARVNEKFNRGAENQAFLVESVNGMETLKSMAIEPQMQNRWEEQLAGYVGASFKAANLNNIANQVAGLINKLVVVLILWIGARAVIQGHLSVGQLIAFNMLAARVSGPVLRLVQLWQDFQQTGVSVQRLGDILNTPTEPGYDQSRLSLPSIKGRIQFDQVSFRYRSDGPEVLRDVSLDIRVGEVIGVVGRSGSGKSTLAKLVQRLYVPERGRVLIDGVDIAQVDTAWLRRRIGVVLQENVLFNRTVRENIALADPGLPMEAVIQAAQLAGAHEFILEMPEGYDTIVGEHGDNLSGGQRQRIAIARALVTNPRILIFDEATSALDYESERIIQQNMQAICKGRTVIIIAHRLSTVRVAHRIIVLEKGQITEQGTHEDLLKRQGQYASLHALQSGQGVQVVKRKPV